MKISNNEIHIWYILTQEVCDLDFFTAHRHLLSAEELYTYQQFYFEAHQYQYILTRVLVRTVLSKYRNVNPQEWVFFKNKYGKPEAIQSGDAPRLRFNLSHTDGLIVCAVILDKDIGIDVENILKKKLDMTIAKRYFSQSEMKDLLESPSVLRKERFFDFWTLKECFVKAKGQGLSIPLQDISFEIQKEGSVKLIFKPKNNYADNWAFWLSNVSSAHKMAVAIHNDNIKDQYNLYLRNLMSYANKKPEISF